MPIEALVVMITPLHKHRGQNGAIAAGFVLVAATILVVMTHPGRLAPGTTHRQIARPAAAAPPVVEAKRAPVTGPITATGVTTFDETVTAHIFAPVPGFVTKVDARAGRKVRAGETLAVMHSYDVLAAELDLVAQVQQFTTQDLLTTARRRVMRLGMPRAVIERVEKTGVATPTLPLVAMRSGTLVKATALPGLFVEPGELFTITDPAKIWVIADVPEEAAVAVGVPAKLRIGSAKPVAAKVAYMYRLVQDGMRKVRFELTTPASIKPGTVVEVTFDKF